LIEREDEGHRSAHKMIPDAPFQPDRARLAAAVRRLAVPRHPVASPRALEEAERYVAKQLEACGLPVEHQAFEWRGRSHNNVVSTLEGSDPSRPWVIVGAHFDSVARSPGADDNASGVAAMLEVARLIAARAERPAATLQFVGFNLEEIQDTLLHYKVGSKFYVERLQAEGRRIAGALVFEMVGFTGRRQVVPAAVQLVKKVPKEGTFLAAVGDGDSGVLLQCMEHSARGVIELVSLAVPLKGWLVPDTRRSDNARFWDAGYPALMVTDTADLRNPHYHQVTDTPDTLNYEFMAQVTEVVAKCAWSLAY
jgi:Zn-dependent M28 family amino/carboxypeptidase